MNHTKPVIIAVANQKGGIGKSTTARELGFFLDKEGRRTLIIDADQQGNLSKGITRDDTRGLYDAVTGNEYRIQAIRDNLFLLPGEQRLAGLEKALLGEVDVYTRLRDTLGPVLSGSYDYVLIDCPPNLGVLTINALALAGYVLIPMVPALYSMQGTNDLLETIRKVRTNLNPGLDILGIVIDMYDPRAHIVKEITAEIEGGFGDKVFCTRLCQSKKVEEAIAEQTGLVYMNKSKIGGEIALLGSEILSRLEGPVPGKAEGGRNYDQKPQT